MRYFSVAWQIKELWGHFLGALFMGSALYFIPALAFQKASDNPGMSAAELFGAAAGYVSTYGLLLLVSNALTVFAAFKEEALDDDVRRVHRLRWLVAVLLLVFSGAGRAGWIFALGGLFALIVVAYRGREQAALSRFAAVFAILMFGWFVASINPGAWPVYVWSFVPAASYVAYTLVLGLVAAVRRIYLTAIGAD